MTTGRERSGAGGDGPSERRASYAEVFSVGEFRTLWLAQLASVAGDQVARVALTVLVFDRTESAGLAALTYALTFLPDLVGGPLLSGLADRYARRRVMVWCDVGRAGLVAAMAVPGMSLWLVSGLLVVMQLLSSPFSAARAAMMKTILEGDRYVVGSSVTGVTSQAAQLAGFAFGGTLVAGLGSGNALLVDAATFALSAVLIRAGVQDHRIQRPDGDGETERAQVVPGWWASLVAGTVLVWRDRRLRALVALACLCGFYVTVEGLAVPYAAGIGGGPIEAGLLMAANPAGQVVGMLLNARLQPDLRMRLMGPLAIGACLPLIPCGLGPGFVMTFGLWALSGLLSAYQVTASATFVQLVPDAQTGQAFGVARTALIVSQGVGILAAGAAADRWSPSTVVAAAGVLGMLAAAGVARSARRAFVGGGR